MATVRKRSNGSLETAWFEIEFAKGSNAIIMKSDDTVLTIPVRKEQEQNGKIKAVKHSVEDGAPIAFDHASLILDGLMRLRGKIDYTDIVFNLMPERFTITQLQQIYEIILGEKLLAPLFRRKIAEKLAETGSYTQEKGHRPSQLFTYKSNSD